jgi:predicted RNA-binding protein with PUA domain
VLTTDERLLRALRYEREQLTWNIRIKTEDIAMMTERLASVNAQLKIDDETER